MYKSSKRYMPTYLIVVFNVAVYIYTALLSGNLIEIDYSILQQWGQYNRLVLNGGYWQLFTSIFVHTSITHLLGNLFFLLIFGLRAEEFFAIKEYLAIYFSSGITGNLLTLLFGPSMVSAGASGAIFGMFGACTIYIRRTFGESIIGALVYSFFLLIINSGQNVNNLAHIGGLVAGLLIGYLLSKKSGQKKVYKYI
ncbi:MAG: rhomboid family intramembrane serine protease [Thermoproteota archaeon]